MTFRQTVVRWLLGLISLCLASVAGASPALGQIADFITDEMAASNVPGMSYGHVRDGEVASGQAGVLEAGQQAPVANDTLFLIGSISKSFTALGVMQLVEAGEVSLDAPVQTYLSEFEAQSGGEITIRQLLSHTSGYSTYQGNVWQGEPSMEADVLERRAQSLAQTPPAYPRQARWEYSNANYIILGRLIEEVSGQDYAGYVEENILRPAGMADSYVIGGSASGRLAVGHRPWFGGRRAISDDLTGRGSGPQGGVVASARDMATYMALMMNGEDDILSADGKTLMMQPANNISPNYGFGWELNEERGLVFHTGSNPGYEALVTMIPAQRQGAAVLLNANSGTGFGETRNLRFGVSAMLLGLDHQNQPPSNFDRATFLIFMILPVLFVIGIVWAWLKRESIRTKRGWRGYAGIWARVVIGVTIAGAAIFMVPRVVGAPLSAIRVFQPDIALGIMVTAALSLIWAFTRMAIRYWPKRTT